MKSVLLNTNYVQHVCKKAANYMIRFTLIGKSTSQIIAYIATSIFSTFHSQSVMF